MKKKTLTPKSNVDIEVKIYLRAHCDSNFMGRIHEKVLKDLANSS